MSLHPEIQALEKLLNAHHISIESVSFQPFTASQHEWILFRLNDLSFPLLIDDEYDDLQIPNKTLHLYLVLRELEFYDEESDLLTWTKSKGINPGNTEVMKYYRELGMIYAQIESELGKIDSYISDLDYQLNSGAIQALRNSSIS
jgi:hypothetical protein